MADYEKTAYLSLEKLKERHQKELEDLHAQVHNFKNKYSPKVLDLWRRVDVLTSQWNYKEAEKYRELLMDLEAQEKDNMIKEMWKDMVKKEKKLKQLHQSQMQALLMRIQRDRNE